MACTGKVTPFIIIGGILLEEVPLSVASPHGEQFIFADWYCELSSSVFTFSWCFLIEDIFDLFMF